jgi:glutaredoxin
MGLGVSQDDNAVPDIQRAHSMKTLIRLFFKTLRAILGPILLFVDWITRPKGIVRPEPEQRAVDARTQSLVLYHFPSCPFCIKTRRVIQRLSLNIEMRNTRHDPRHRQTLLDGGGKPQVPCLQITDTQGRSTWMYESGDIIAYLKREFGSA